MTKHTDAEIFAAWPFSPGDSPHAAADAWAARHLEPQTRVTGERIPVGRPAGLRPEFDGVVTQYDNRRPAGNRHQRRAAEAKR